MYPFYIKYKRTLHTRYTREQVLDQIEKEFIRLKVDNIKRSSFTIEFRNSLHNDQNAMHLMASVDKGYIKIDNHLNNFEYAISVLRMFYFATAAALFFGLIAQSFWAGIFGFVWLFGLNLMTAYIRQFLFANRLKKELSM